MPEYTEIACATPESAHALHAYLLADLAQDEEAPDITAEVKDSALRVTYNFDDEKLRQAWDWLLIGHRDGRESLEGTLREARRVIKELRRSVIDDWQAEQMIDDAVKTIDGALGISG